MQSESLHQITKGDSASHFHKIRLGDALSFVVDNRGKTPPLDDKGTHDLLEINAIVGQKKFPNFELVSKRVNSGVYESWFRKGHPKVGDVLFSTVGSIAEVAYVAEERGCIAQNLVALRPKADVLDGEFLYYTLSSFVVKQRIISLDISSVQPSIKLPHLMDFEIELPPISSQVKIASFLGKLDDKIALNRQINQTLEAMAQAIFKSWFVDFDPVKAKIAAIEAGQDPLRAAMSAISGKNDVELDAMPSLQYDELAATAALFPEELVESELGDVPKGWEISKIEKILERLSSKTRYTKDQVLEIGVTPVFEQGASIVMGYHNGVAVYHASLEDPIFIFGDHTCITRISYQPFDISQNVIPLKGKNYPTSWVYYSIREKQKFQEYRRHWMELVSKDVVVATTDICFEFSRKIVSLHVLLEANERQIQSLQELRDTLLPKLLSGELSVSSPSGLTESMAGI